MLASFQTDYPLQKKSHSLEFLREMAHIRPRSNTIGAMLRMRDEVSTALRQFFKVGCFLGHFSFEERLSMVSVCVYACNSKRSS